jgi:uncharacterized protein (DUF362 family)
MRKLLGRVKRKLFKPELMRKKVVEGTFPPRRKTTPDNPPQVLRVSAAAGAREALAAMEPYLEGVFAPGQKVLIKINLNTANPYPASTNPATLAALLDFLSARGIDDITVGDCCSIRVLPTTRVIRQTGIPEVVAGRGRLACFDPGPWVRVPVNGVYLKEVTVPRLALEADRVISLANLKTHNRAGFTCGLKLAVGFMHPMERPALHSAHLGEKIAEISLAVPADLVLVDAGVVFITGGPDEGRAEKADTFLAGTNLLAVDLEAYRLLYELKSRLGCREDFPQDPFLAAQLGHARDLGLGGANWQGYRVTEIQGD